VLAATPKCRHIHLQQVNDVSTGVSKLGLIDRTFIDARLREICGEFFIFQQCNVAAHLAPRQSTFWNETPAFILPDLSPPNNTDLNPIDHNI